MSTNSISYTNTWAEFRGPAAYQARELLSYRQKGYTFTSAHRRGGWDGRVFMMTSKGRFPAGLVPWLVERMAKEGITVEVRDQRPEPLPSIPLLSELQSSAESRYYQQGAITEAFTQRRGIVQHPTGAGKTETIIALTHLIGRQALVLVHTKNLLDQTAERFMKTLGCGEETIGVIGDGQWEPRVITIATFQTLYARLKEKIPEVERWLREDIGQVHVDEVQHLPARTFAKVMAQLWSAYWRLGYSATPLKSGDAETLLKVMSWIGPILHQVPAEELVEKGYLVPADVFLIRMQGSPAHYKDWQEAVKCGIVENAYRNERIVNLARVAPKPVIIPVERLDHGERLAKELNTEFIAGTTPTGKRRTAWEGMRQGKIPILVVSKVADEGLDIPEIQSIVMAGGGKAPHLTIQRVGRGQRTADQKQRLFCFDFLDEGKYLSAHAKRRRRTYQEQPAFEVHEVDYSEVCR